MSDLRYTSVVVDDDLQFAQRVAEFVDGCVVCTVDEFLEWTDPDTIRVALLKPGAQFDGVRARARLLGFSLVVLAPESLTDQGEVDAQFIGAPNENLGALVHSVASGNRLKRERDRLSRQLRHGVRLEAFSRIAGGVAHDFNNLLTTVGCFAGFVEESGVPESIDDAREILRASERGTELTKRLVALSRDREVRSEPLDLSTVVSDNQRLLAKSAGPAIRLSFDLRSGLSPVSFDRSDLEQALLHAVLQARDGFSRGGQILIRSWQRGRHVGLEIEDDGPGLSDDAYAAIFDENALP
ncbi:MAG: hypothetical protein AAFQ82_04675, partial [Myxococcota bacterium]